MKKIFILIICFNILTLPVLAEYDFSDSAQAEFDRQQKEYSTNFNNYNNNQNISRDYSDLNQYNDFQNFDNYGNNEYVNTTKEDFSKKKEKKEIKNNRTNYIPPQETQENNYVNTYPQYNNFDNQLNAKTQYNYSNNMSVPAGTKFLVTFDSGISSGTLEKNDRLTVKLTNDLIYNGKLIAPAGSIVYGNAVNAKSAGCAYGSGAMEIVFTQILPPTGDIINISTKKIRMVAPSKRAKKMTRDVVVGALGSMLVGAAFTAIGGGDNWGRNMLVYGGLGALGGGLRGTMQRGDDFKIPDGTTIELTLIQPLYF